VTPVRASGVGSLPHQDPLEAATAVLEHLHDIPHVPELPRRGRGADAIGRTAALLVDLPVEVAGSQWQVAARAGAELRLARGYLDDDLSALTVAAHGYTGALKVQVVGPLTLAAAVARPRGDVASSDPGLRRDLAASLAEGLAAHLAQVQSRLPAAELVVQVDEPSLPAVLRGSLPTRSGWARLPAVDAGEASALLRTVLAPAPAGTVVHCCAPGVPWTTLRDAGTSGVGFDLDLASDADLDEMGATLDAGGTLWIGVVPTAAMPAQPPSAPGLARRAQQLWRRLGFSSDVVRERTVLTPACGLAGWDEAHAVSTYRALQEASTRLSDDDSRPAQ
jgi:methionine synthase II (cobalamin-independent)